MNAFIKKTVYKVFSKFMFKYGDKSAVYITFDDGPHPENTPKILDILKKYNVKATFFMTGSEMKKFPEIVRKVIVDGHSIGYHSYSHFSYKKLPIFSIIKELSLGRSLAKAFGTKLRLFRPPYGDLTPLSFLYLIFTGWKIIMWSLDSRDSFDDKAKVIETTDVKNLVDGDIILFHDDYKMTIEILPEILEKYYKRKIHCKAL